MNRYQKTAIFILRFIGFLFVSLSLIGIIYGLLGYITQSPFFKAPNYAAARFGGSFFYGLLGLLFYVFAMRWGRFLGKGLD